MKKTLLLISFVSFMSILSGCSNAPISSESSGVWNHYVIYPFSQLIHFFAHLMNDNYGLAIIVMTILIRFLMLPLTLKQTMGQERMKEIQPEIQQIREKYPDNDRESRLKLQNETLAIYSKYKVSPLSMGCLPLLIQMPILLGFYYAIVKTKEIALHNFLWFNLGAADPLHLLPLIAAVTTYIQYKTSTNQLSDANPQMKMMGILMPVIILISAWKLSAVLPLYWIVGNIFLTVQTFIIKQTKKKTTSSGF